jgi:hypothetical protein
MLTLLRLLGRVTHHQNGISGSSSEGGEHRHRLMMDRANVFYLRIQYKFPGQVAMLLPRGQHTTTCETPLVDQKKLYSLMVNADEIPSRHSNPVSSG